MLIAVRAYGQADASTLDGILVRWKAGQVAVTADTAPRDGRFAVGWTIQLKEKQPAVNWSAYEVHKDAADYPASMEVLAQAEIVVSPLAQQRPLDRGVQLEDWYIAIKQSVCSTLSERSELRRCSFLKENAAQSL